MDWDKLRIFHAVALAKSFTRAGDTLNLSQSAISRQISALEDGLQVSLFHRHARGLLLTEQGEILFSTVSEILQRLSSAENALLETRERPKGPLKITVPVGFGTAWLAHHMQEFNAGYPDITVTLLVDDRELDLTMREADVAIRLYPARHPDLVQRHLVTLENGLYASHDYVRQHGAPKRAEDFGQHRLISYPGEVRLPFEGMNWMLRAGLRPGEERKAVLKINNIVGIYYAVCSGLGIASLPHYLASQSDELVHILPELEGPKVDVYFIYPLELKNSKRINVFRDFLLRKLSQSGLLPIGKSHAKIA